MDTAQKDLFDLIIAKENLYRAAHRAAFGKRFRDNIALWRLDIEKQVDRLHRDLKAGSYRHGRYRTFEILDPKRRMISVAPFRDRVVHHALHDVIELFVDRRFIYDSYACRPGKGTHAALDRAQGFLRANRYCFHGDIRKYFPSVDHEVLKGLLRRHIADAKVLTVLDGIIDSSGGRGLPIGNLTSQFFANLYLHEMDLFVKQTLRERYYIRYMDDFLVFSNDKPALHAVRNTLRAFLRDRLRLVLHEGKSQIYDGSCGLKFLGFRIYHDHRRLATAGVRRFRARLKRFRSLLGTGQVAPEHAADSVCSWRAHSLHADTVRLRQRLAEEVRPWSEALSSVLLPKLRPPQPRRLGRLLAATMVFVVFCSCPAWAIGFGGGDGRGEASVLLGSRALMQIQSAAEQAFTYGDAATAASSVTVTQEFSAGDGVATVTGIRIRVPAGLGMTWDDSILTATVTGDAAAKVSASAPAVTVSYEDSAKTLVVPVITNFSDGDVVVLSGLKFADFTMSGSDNLLLEIDNAGTVIERDRAWKRISLTERASGFGGSLGRGEGQAAIEHHPPHALSFGAPF